MQPVRARRFSGIGHNSSRNVHDSADVLDDEALDHHIIIDDSLDHDDLDDYSAQHSRHHSSLDNDNACHTSIYN